MAINAEVLESHPHIRFKLDAPKTCVDSLNQNENKDLPPHREEHPCFYDPIVILTQTGRKMYLPGPAFAQWIYWEF